MTEVTLITTMIFILFVGLILVAERQRNRGRRDDKPKS